MSDQALVKRLEEPESAGDVFRTLLRKGAESKALVVGIAANPRAALVALQHGADALGLNAADYG